MKTATNYFLEKLDERNIRYSILKESFNSIDESDIIHIIASGDNVSNLQIAVFISDDTVSVRAFSIAKTPENRKNVIMEKINELHNKYRWITFYIDNDNNLNARMDAYFNNSWAGEICLNGVFRIFNIVDESYPEFMRYIW